VDLNTRQLRYFVVVAEELHFTRAAKRLFISQQSLSARIRELESAVGATLLLRSTRRVELTPAGELFLGEAREALAALDRAVDGVRQIVHGAETVLSIGFMGSAALELTAPILTEFARRHPHVRVDLHEYLFEDTSAGLSSMAVDIAFLRLPITLPEGRFERLFVDPRCICVSAEHRLAARESVSVTEILGEPITAPRGSDAAWRAHWLLEDVRGDSPPIVAAQIGSIAEELDGVSLGKHATITVAGVARFAPRPGLRVIPIHDIPGTETVIGWRVDHESPLIRAFVGVARDVRERESDLVALIERGG
jgi:DNA-binding transcriptional LysR family regulator